jgi:hypothetical protein
VRKEAGFNETAKGKLEIIIKGQSKDGERELSLSQVKANYREDDAALEFKYFQKIEGSIIIPKGFKPTDITIKAIPDSDKYGMLINQYAWDAVISNSLNK